MKDGYILKSKIGTKVSEEELKLINKYTRRALTAEEVYTFTVVLCDNDIDRDYECFDDNALEKLAELFVGKTGILDHNASSDKQTARIYSCKTEGIEGKRSKNGRPYKRLLAHAYMPICDKNKDLILEIDSGIKKEVSVGCVVENKFCSVCGKDWNIEKCAHRKGRRYKKENRYEPCYLKLSNPTDAYEWSFVAVPAQREAGVIKAMDISNKGGETVMKDISKSLNSGKDLTLSTAECEKLCEFIGNLEKKASLSMKYREELINDVMKLSGLVQPEVDQMLMGSIAKKLSIEELKAFRESFRNKLSKIIPPSPQFTPEETDNKNIENRQFKI